MRKDTKLSPNFTYREFLVSQTAVRKGIKNAPSENDLENLIILAQRLELIRSLSGDRPIVVTSGFRSPELNKEIGGAKHSAHMDGRAADIICPKLGSPNSLFKKIKDSDIKFDQLIYEFGSWVHFGIAVRNRKQVLIATRKNGVVHYKKVT